MSRSREEIEEIVSQEYELGLVAISYGEMIMLEVLLDIRDLLSQIKLK